MRVWHDACALYNAHRRDATCAVPCRSGKMDQACAFGMVAVLMTYDGDLLHVRRIPNRSPLHLVLVDLGAAKDTVAILHGLQVGRQLHDPCSASAWHAWTTAHIATMCACATDE